jgi:DNA-binding IclR family transcriptional regulator
MARPALSAARGIDILDLLAASPARGMTMSDIARATGINIASCHAVLTVLVERGYLLRDAQSKSYGLGPVVHAAGQAALAAQSLLAHAEAAARALFEELRIPVMMSAAVGDGIVGIVSIGERGGSPPLLRPGERRPRIPPVGAPFVAWSGEPAIEAWLASAPERAGDAALRRAVETIRNRGFEVLLRTTGTSRMAAQLRDMADPRALGSGGLHPLGPDMALPDRIEPEALYDVTMIAAPIFDRHGACAFNLCLGPFPEMLAGQAILDLAERLHAACLQAMHADRGR